VLRGVAWNLMLAAIPVPLAYATLWGLGRRGGARRLSWWLIAPLAVAWLAFLPNSCYLLTEWRHLLFDPRWKPLLDAGPDDAGAMMGAARWSLFFVGYSGVGVLLFVLSVRPFERILRASGLRFLWLAPLFFGLMSVGVYLGLRIRLNSWDLVQRPAVVWTAVSEALSSHPRMVAIAVFAGLLWALYEAVDIWVDGVSQRLGSRTAKPRRTA